MLIPLFMVEEDFKFAVYENILSTSCNKVLIKQVFATFPKNVADDYTIGLLLYKNHEGNSFTSDWDKVRDTVNLFLKFIFIFDSIYLIIIKYIFTDC